MALVSVCVCFLFFLRSIHSLLLLFFFLLFVFFWKMLMWPHCLYTEIQFLRFQWSQNIINYCFLCSQMFLLDLMYFLPIYYCFYTLFFMFIELRFLFRSFVWMSFSSLSWFYDWTKTVEKRAANVPLEQPNINLRQKFFKFISTHKHGIDFSISQSFFAVFADFWFERNQHCSWKKQTQK